MKKVYFASSCSYTAHDNGKSTTEFEYSVDEKDVFYEAEDYIVVDSKHGKHLITKEYLDNMELGPYFTSRTAALAFLRNHMQKILDKRKHVTELYQKQIDEINREL